MPPIHIQVTQELRDEVSAAVSDTVLAEAIARAVRSGEPWVALRGIETYERVHQEDVAGDAPKDFPIRVRGALARLIDPDDVAGSLALAMADENEHISVRAAEVALRIQYEVRR